MAFRAAVVVVRGQADQRGDPLARPLTQLRQVGQECPRHLRADADNRLQHLVPDPEGLRLFDDRIHALFQREDLLLQVADVGVDAGHHLRRPADVAVVLLGRQHADQLAAAVVELLEFLDLRGRQRPNGGLDDLAEMGQDPGVDGVGLGQVARGLGEVADLPGVDHDGRQSGGEQGADRRLLVVAGRLEHDPLRADIPGPRDQGVDAGRVVGEPARGVRGVADGGVQMVRADIHADENTAHDKPPERRRKRRGRTEASPVQAGECGASPR